MSHPNQAEHVWPVRVYWEDTDAGGIVYHASYIRFAERGRTEMLRALGYDQSKLAADTGMFIAVRAGSFEFLAPAKLDDVLEVHTSVSHIGGASLNLEQRIIRPAGKGADDRTVFSFDVRLVCINAAGRPIRWPQMLRRAFESLQSSTEICDTDESVAARAH